MGTLNELMARDGEEARASVPYAAASIAGICVHSTLIAFFAVNAVWPMAAFNVASVACFVIVRVMVTRRRLLAGLLLATSEIVVHQALAVLFCGLEANFQVHLFAVVPLCLMLPGLTERQRFAAALAPLAMYAALVFGAPMSGQHPLSPHVVRVTSSVNLLLAFAMCFLVVLHYRRAVDEAERTLADQYDRTERLLHGVLPPSIVERLRREPGVLADRVEGATVLFADLVGFTSLAQRRSPEQLVALLDEIFAAFDEVTERHGLEKIKTIGDAYMVAGGVPSARPDHAVLVARFALDARASFAALAARHGEPLALRMGMQTGPVVAGVIGRTKFAYDLWGDVVNTAARMESHGEPGRIHVTREVADALRGEFELVERGEIDVKGKGRMQTFWLEQSPVAQGDRSRG